MRLKWNRGVGTGYVRHLRSGAEHSGAKWDEGEA
jgi:hypothetical protein